MASEAGAAGGRADDAAGIGKDVEQPFLHGLTPDGGRRGQDDTAHALGDLAALEHFGGVAHVGDAAVGAGADDHLIDGHVLHFGNGLGVFGQVRAGHLRLHVAHIDAYDSFIRRTGIGRNEFRIGAVVIAAIGERFLVGREQAALAARFNRHIGDAEARFDVEFGEGFAAEFQRLVQGAVHADVADEPQDQVLAAQPFGHLAFKFHADGRGHLEPQPAERHTGGDVRGAEAGRECAEAAVGAGVAVRADHEVAGLHEALFGQEGVLDAAVAAFIVVGDVHFLRELAGHHHLIGGIDVLLRGEVVHHQKDAILVEHLGRAHRPEGLDGERSGDVVGEHAGKMAVDDLPGFTDFFIRVGLKDFLGKSMRHGTAPEGKRFPDRRAKTPFRVSSSIGIVTTFFRPKDQRPANRFPAGNRDRAGKTRHRPSAGPRAETGGTARYGFPPAPRLSCTY